MRLHLKTALNNLEIAPREPDETLKVWVLYENAALCNRALALLNRVAEGIEGKSRIVCAISRLAAFGDPQLSRILAHETEAADLIVIAASGDMELPRSLKNLISGAKPLKRVGVPHAADTGLKPGANERSA